MSALYIKLTINSVNAIGALTALITTIIIIGENNRMPVLGKRKMANIGSTKVTLVKDGVHLFT